MGGTVTCSNDEGGFEPILMWSEAHNKRAFAFSMQDPGLALLRERDVWVAPCPNGFMARTGDRLLCIEVCGKGKKLFRSETGVQSFGFSEKTPLFSWSLSKKQVLNFSTRGSLGEVWPREWNDPWTLMSLAILMAAFDRGTFGMVRDLSATFETAQGVRAAAFPGRTWDPWGRLAKVQANRHLWETK